MKEKIILQVTRTYDYCREADRGVLKEIAYEVDDTPYAILTILQSEAKQYNTEKEALQERERVKATKGPYEQITCSLRAVRSNDPLSLVEEFQVVRNSCPNIWTYLKRNCPHNCGLPSRLKHNSFADRDYCYPSRDCEKCWADALVDK